MKKETPYLNFYKRCMESGYMPAEGLCGSLGKESILQFYPTREEFGSPKRSHGGSEIRHYLWGATGTYGEHGDMGMRDMSEKFTPLRQTIVLFMAAMNKEL